MSALMDQFSLDYLIDILIYAVFLLQMVEPMLKAATYPLFID